MITSDVREIWEAALVSARTSISWKEVVRDWGFLLDMLYRRMMG